MIIVEKGEEIKELTEYKEYLEGELHIVRERLSELNGPRN
jgi:hypothetical protein